MVPYKKPAAIKNKFLAVKDLTYSLGFAGLYLRGNKGGIL
jgi:hypothetical protein